MILGVSRSGYYKRKNAEPSAQALKKTEIMERISYHFYDKNEQYGSPRITRLLHEEGYNVTERTVSIYMKELNIRKRYGTPSGADRSL
ncbi:IS3 family transposase [Cohnella thailandensis]|uniref:IS3 family transposase n=1 Tax=Cohnella thailandensis TaxID=557557 RepID=A0A841T4W4_9BACL|nr:IS3 family transposase [Cohnella thailandensis]MBB6636171.1 IS3 family transposase [Cohnella thailandensis]MBP1973860.1 repressor of nif and glnA expression [Cohnella thailandensis]